MLNHEEDDMPFGSRVTDVPSSQFASFTNLRDDRVTVRKINVDQRKLDRENWCNPVVVRKLIATLRSIYSELR
jgi:hypothetical protein